MTVDRSNGYEAVASEHVARRRTIGALIDEGCTVYEDGRRLRAVEQLRGRGRDQDNVWIFDRR